MNLDANPVLSEDEKLKNLASNLGALTSTFEISAPDDYKEDLMKKYAEAIITCIGRNKDAAGEIKDPYKFLSELRSMRGDIMFQAPDDKHLMIAKMFDKVDMPDLDF